MDKYDEAISYLTDHPDELNEAWSKPYEHEAGCLFMFLGEGYGCLTQIKNGSQGAPNFELRNRILEDKRVPDDVVRTKLQHLPVFAEYQREADLLGVR